MKYIKLFETFRPINESLLYIWSRLTRIGNLIDSDFYNIEDINKWMIKYDFDKLAKCLIVSEDQIKQDHLFDFQLSQRDIENSIRFNTESKEGYLIEESKIEHNGQIGYLYVFKKGSNKKNRARQIHGFIYENEIIKLNGLENFREGHKWDAFGTMKESFIRERIKENRQVFYVDGSYQKELKSNNINNIISHKFRTPTFWNIKNISKFGSIDMGDILRISGLKRDDSGVIVKIPNSEMVDDFLLAIGLHENGIMKEEFFVKVDIEKWSEIYSADFYSKLDIVNNMFNELEQHRLKGDRTDDTEKKWYEFMNRYKNIFNDGIIKLRFKRDTKGQLRIQGSISLKDFTENILTENPYINIKYI